MDNNLLGIGAGAAALLGTIFVAKDRVPENAYYALLAGSAGTLGYFSWQKYKTGSPQLSSGSDAAGSGKIASLSDADKVALWKKAAGSAPTLGATANTIAFGAPVPDIKKSAATLIYALNGAAPTGAYKQAYVFADAAQSLVHFATAEENVPAGMVLFLSPGEAVAVMKAAGGAYDLTPLLAAAAAANPAGSGAQELGFSGVPTAPSSVPTGIVNPFDYFNVGGMPSIPMDVTPYLPTAPASSTPASSTPNVGTVWDTQGGGMFAPRY